MAQTDKEKELYDLAYGSVMSGAQAEKPQYAGTYDQQLNDIYSRIQNREKFSYDVNADPLYQNYKDQYIQGGKLAMKDTMGQAAALTGGYGNTYGQQVGQQAYDAYLQNLSAVIPELYGMAYNMYQDEGNQLKDLYGMVGQLRDVEYGRYRDELGDWERGQQAARDLEALEHDRRMQAEALAREQERYDYEKAWNEEQRDYERNRYNEQTEYERQMYAEQIARELENQEYQRRTAEEQEAYNRRKYNEQVGRQLEQQEYERQQAAEAIARQLEQQGYQRQQDALSNLLSLIKLTGYRPTDAELSAAGLTRTQADALANEFDYQRSLEQLAMEAATSGGSSGGSSGGGGRGSSGGSSYGYDDYYDESYYDNYYVPSGVSSSLANSYESAMSTGALANYVASKKESAPLSFNSQREFDDYLRQQIYLGNLTKQEATDLRDSYSGPGAQVNGTVIKSAASTPVKATTTVGAKTGNTGTVAGKVNVTTTNTPTKTAGTTSATTSTKTTTTVGNKTASTGTQSKVNKKTKAK